MHLSTRRDAGDVFHRVLSFIGGFTNLRGDQYIHRW